MRIVEPRHNEAMDYIKDIVGFDRERIDSLDAKTLSESGSDKWSRYPGCIGAFIAEMDFGLAPAVKDAVERATEQCSLGYIPDPWKHNVAVACADWQRARFGWDIDPRCIRPVPDVLEAYEVFLRDIVGAGHRVLIPTPAYMPFLSVPRLYDVTVDEVPMLRVGDSWQFDFEAIERCFAEGCRAFVLCNPHNPIGKVLTMDELNHIIDLADHYDVRVFADEIHAPFVFEGHRHIPYASISEKAARQAFSATSASKSFNIPGTKCAQVILTNPDDYAMWMDRAEWSEHQTATIGAIATTAAYTEGGPWFDQVLEYVEENAKLVDQRMRADFPEVGYVRPEGTYIAWLDFNGLGLDEPAEFFLDHAKVALTDGRECGRIGAGCVRFNFAMPRPLLDECFDRMRRALDERAASIGATKAESFDVAV